MSSSHVHNIILFGEVGCGRSSVVNMIVGNDVAKVSSETLSCTFRSDAYDTTIGDTRFRIYDTAGLNGGDHGRVPHWRSVNELYTLIRGLDGVSLLNKVICAEQVPTIAVVTGLENEPDWQDQSKMKKFRTAFASYNIRPHEIASIVAIRGKRGEFTKHYETSQKKLRKLIVECRRKEPWNTGKEEKGELKELEATLVKVMEDNGR